MHRTHLAPRPTSGRLWALVVLLLLAAIGAGYFFSNTVDQVRIGSERYDRIVALKELQSEVSAQSLQVIEAQLRVQEMALTPDEVTAGDLTALGRLNRGYEQRYDSWSAQLAGVTSPDLEAALDASHEAAGAYFDALEGPFLTAARAGDRPGMQEAVSGVLAQQYALQQATAEKVADVAQEQLLAVERAVAADVAADRRLLLAVGSGFGLLAVALTMVTLRSTSSRVRRMRILVDKEFPRLLTQAEASAEVGIARPSASPPIRGHDELARAERGLHRVVDTAVDLAGETARLRHTTADLFAYAGRRNHQLLSRGLTRLSGLEALGLDPRGGADLAELRSALTRMQRDAERMLVIAGAAAMRQWDSPVPPMQSLQAALAQIDGTDRVGVDLDDSVLLAGPVGADLAQLLAELLDNATRFSPPESSVTVRGLREGDDYVISVSDDGLGMPAVRLAAANALLANSEVDLHDSRQWGLSVVARLADRHDLEVTLAAGPTGGLVALVRIPASCLHPVVAPTGHAELSPAPSLAPSLAPSMAPSLALSLAPVASASQTAPPGPTSSGEPIPLPRRIRGASLDPSRHDVPAYVGAPERRSPEAVRDALTALSSGQAAATDRHPGPTGLTS